MNYNALYTSSRKSYQIMQSISRHGPLYIPSSSSKTHVLRRGSLLELHLLKILPSDPTPIAHSPKDPSRFPKP